MRITLDGEAIEAEEGDTVAAALLRSRITTFTRSIKYHRPRGPFCLQGSCGQCLMRIDGVPSLMACQVRAEEGMVCGRQNAPLGLIEADVFRAADFLFPEGLDHHHLLTGSRVLGRVALEIARRLAGLGELPSRVREAQPAELRQVRLAVVGAGPAGLAAARAAASEGARVLLLEREARAGGAAWLAVDPAAPAAAWVEEQVRALRTAGGEVLLGAECVGLYANEPRPPVEALLAVRRSGGLLVVAAERVIVANGGASQPLPFPGVDRPGVYAARGLLSLYARSKVRVGQKLVVLGDGKELIDCARALRLAGYELASVVALSAERPEAPDLEVQEAQPVRALGNPVRAIEIAPQASGFEPPASDLGPEAPGVKLRARIRCDAVAIALSPAPLHGLASSVGAAAKWVPALHGFPLQIDADGRTAVPWLFAAGRVAGLGGAAAVASGEAAGKAACR
jgi:sarcosine oxidase subunit alpha